MQFASLERSWSYARILHSIWLSIARVGGGTTTPKGGPLPSGAADVTVVNLLRCTTTAATRLFPCFYDSVLTHGMVGSRFHRRCLQTLHWTALIQRRPQVFTDLDRAEVVKSAIGGKQEEVLRIRRVFLAPPAARGSSLMGGARQRRAERACASLSCLLALTATTGPRKA